MLLNEIKYVSERYCLTQDRINKFAKASGGYGKIHVDPEHAKNTIFKVTLAHGFHLVAMIEKELNSLYPSRKDGMLEVKFVKPIKVNEEFIICCEPDEHENLLKVTILNELNEVAVVGTASKYHFA